MWPRVSRGITDLLARPRSSGSTPALAQALGPVVSLVNAIRQTVYTTNSERPCTTAGPIAKALSSCRSVSPLGLVRLLCWVGLNRKLHVLWYPSVNTFKFQSCNHTPPRARSLAVSLGRGARPLPRRHRLGREVERSLIVVHPRAFALDQLAGTCRLPPLSRVLTGSSYFTHPQSIRTAPCRHVPARRPALLRWPVRFA